MSSERLIAAAAIIDRARLLVADDLAAFGADAALVDCLSLLDDAKSQLVGTAERRLPERPILDLDAQPLTGRELL